MAMSDNELPTMPEEPSTAGPDRPMRLRWQLILLGLGLLMIAAGGLYLLLPRSAARPVEPIVTFTESQVYSEAIVGEPALVNPLLASSQADLDLVELVFSGLTRLDEFGEPIPDLAENWEVSPDGLTYPFTLRSDATWHDGVPFTADDVTFTMSILRDPRFSGPDDLATFWRTVETYADDERTVRFVLTQPLASFPEYLRIGILPAHILAGVEAADLPDDPFNLSPVGTGRLRWASLEERRDMTQVRLIPYEGFYDPARRVRFDEVDLYFYREAADAFSALGGDVQALGGLTPAQLDAVLASPGLEVYSARLPVYAAIIFNQQAPTRLPFFQEESVRRALALALNREELLSTELTRHLLLTDSTVLPGTWAYNPALTPTPYDPEQAAQLLDEAGWALGGRVRSREEVPLSFTLLVGDRPADRELGQSIVEQWQALGVDVTLEVLDTDELLDRLQTPDQDGEGRDFDAALVEFSQGRLADPDPYPFWHESQADSGQNYSGFADRDISEALEIARRDPNGVRRAELYRSYQQWFIDRAAAILLYNPVYHYAVSCQVQGVQLKLFVGPADRFQNMHEWRIVPPDALQEFCPG